MQCEHGPCDCTETTFDQNGKQFCSEACAVADEGENPFCPCDHPECSGHE